MPAKEIKELRQAGKLEEAYAMAKAELEADLSNIWGKRNLSWVLYAQLDELASNLDAFIEKINEVKELDLPESEEMFFENISIVISKAARVITHEATLDINKIHRLFDSIKELSLKRNSKWFSVLFNAMYKGMKESNRYIEFADWWDFKNFRPEDFQKEKISNGKEIMSISERAYITYAKYLLPKQSANGEIVFDKEKAIAFQPTLAQLAEEHPQLTYPSYFNCKLLMALGKRENLPQLLMSFVRKKRNDFWAWEILAEALEGEPERVFACYCKALSCKSSEEMLVSLRQKMARILISRKLYKEACIEIGLLINSKLKNGHKIPQEVTNWQSANWYKSGTILETNLALYHQYLHLAENLIFNDIPEQSIFVEFVNSEKKILKFITRDKKYGAIKYHRFFPKVKIGDTIKVRFQGGQNDGMHQVYTAELVNDEILKQQFIKDVTGIVIKKLGNEFGFLDDIFISPALIKKYNIVDGMEYSGRAIFTFNPLKRAFSWKLL